MTEKVMNKIRKNRNFTFVERTNEDNSKSNKQGDEGQQRFVEVPSNGQDEENKSGDFPSDKKNITFESENNKTSSNMIGSNNSSQKLTSSLSKKTG